MSSQDFYAALTPFYHLIYPNWEESVEHQAAMLDALIRDYWGHGVQSILDVACGIGTQCLGLAQRGYQLTASDLSSEEVMRARAEAAKRLLSINFSVADMRDAFRHHAQQFDLVIACDNAVPHLLSDEEIGMALQQFYACARPGGGCLISVRDYEKELGTGCEVKLYGMRDHEGKRYLVFQVWDWQEQHYDVAMYFVEDHGGAECVTHVMRSRYYAVTAHTLIRLMQEAGFVDVQCLDDRFFQPVIVGKRAGG
ncbi:class I SAM-dependent methyltransferase [Candidatus Entotheonella palauensis]|uniref:class I SAM-dependent methyltransferase n=1 Tax=Candidatus Entotheonella palauensis TaxID=93172 RepID=UPI002117A8BB|nr:class I SAM-dependent methyltransferase [Candidatus Entotheonella palauensis]